MPIKPVMRPRKEVDISTYEGRFAVRLKTLREKAGYSVESFAEELGMKLSTVYAWEQGVNSPNIATLPKIAEVLKIETIRNLLPAK